jgi:hypothetical protein
MAAAVVANPTDININVMASTSAATIDQYRRTRPGTCLMRSSPA